MIPLVGVFLIDSRRLIANVAAGAMKFLKDTRLVPRFENSFRLR
ncbi:MULTISPECIES: hypothetical protein [Streptomyces]|nr:MULTISPECIES: hypothetical protein [Streptomyces]MDI5907525.1 hypothetical protein [Streptomyces sp. 12257]